LKEAKHNTLELSTTTSDARLPSCKVQDISEAVDYFQVNDLL